MAETTRCLPIIEEEEIDDDFYEKIEAPKFVDFTAPDVRRSDDDRHWFCLRFGCDQKHEQELDSEAIYKNFVLRVMAARSPNVRLRKALNRREASANLKCPLTAPAKSRVSRMPLISSLSHKMNDNNVKVKPLSKFAAATPNAKVKQPPSVAKALTTPRNQNKVSKLEQFRSVQSKKAMTVVAPKSRVIAKALVFHSPKKVVKTKSSVELNTAMKTLCSAMNKLELSGGKKNGEGCNNPLPVAASRKQFRGREVKSRVFDSLYSNNRKEQETNNLRCLKERKVKGMQKRQVTVPRENDSSNKEMMDEKSRGDSLERCPESGTSGGGSELSLGDEESQEQTRGESSVLALSEASRDGITSLSSLNEEENKTTKGGENEERKNPVSETGKVQEAKKRKDGDNSVASAADKENESELTVNDDKENATAPDENIAMSTNDGDPKKAIHSSKHEDSRKTHKKSTLTSTGSQVVQYRKLKPTNPKPFKLRTDERGILKEANLDKKIPSPSAKGGKAIGKHQNVNLNRKNETCPSRSEQDIDNYSSCDERSNQTTQENQSGCIQNDKKAPHRNPGPKLQKPIDLDDNFKRKSVMMQRKVVRPGSALSRNKEKVLLATASKLNVIIEKPSDIVKPKEAAKTRKNDASSPTSNADSSSRPCSRGRRRALTVPKEPKALTVPKEPKFQSLHVPKSCTTRKPT
ncbi:uncharacterized protein LOC133312855 [Gastrolobium bilobum]|uniref:uncharacterized protein LOC133312855 n=1 Tax=Gastrolobium bilobum TaxID=150636 RepID=UPI002AB1D854|nr:uncharacterized protein LOC133312855 [Gastrolobium bilobum]